MIYFDSMIDKIKGFVSMSSCSVVSISYGAGSAQSAPSIVETCVQRFLLQVFGQELQSLSHLSTRILSRRACH